MTTYTQTLVLREPKKHSVRYDAQPTDQNPITSTIYISKSVLPMSTGVLPTRVKITLEYE